MALGPIIVGKGRVRRNIMVTIRQATRLQVTGLSSTVVSIKPGPIVGFSAVAVNATQVNLTWSNPTTGGLPSGLELNRRITGSGAGGWSGNLLSAVVTSFSDTGRTADTSYDYRLRPVSGTSLGDYVTDTVTTMSEPGGAADFIIPAGGNATWNGTVSRPPLTGGPNRAVQPGDIIELAAGTHNERTLVSIVGTASVPVTIRGPQTGRAIIRPSSAGASGFVMTFEACRYFVVDGFTTDASVPLELDGKRHSIKVMHAANASPSNKENVTAYIKFKGSSSSGSGTYNVSRNCLFRYVHIDGGWDPVATNSLSILGIGFSTNDHNYSRNSHPGQWHEGVTLEHVFFKNLGGEGTYCGPNPFLANQAGGADVPTRYIKTRYSMFYNIGGNGVSNKSVFDGQPGGDAATDNSVHHCIFIRCGLDAGANGTVACTLNSARSAIYNCWFEDCGFGAFNINVSQGTNVGFPGSDPTFPVMFFNNVIKNCATLGTQHAINTLTHSSIPASYFPKMRAFQNTILNHGGGNVISAANANPTGSFVRNNLCPGGNIAYGPLTNNGSNVTSGTPASTFVDAVGTYLGGNLNLRPSSAILASGTLASGTAPGSWSQNADIASFDFDDQTRFMPGADVGAYEKN